MTPSRKEIPRHASFTQVRVRYAETDQMGVVYYANYPVWFEVGRAAFMRARGKPYGEWERAGYILPVSAVSYRLYKSAHYDELISVATWIDKIRSRSIHFHYRIIREEQLLAEGETVHICVNPDQKPTRLPQQFISAIEPGKV